MQDAADCLARHGALGHLEDGAPTLRDDLDGLLL